MTFEYPLILFCYLIFIPIIFIDIFSGKKRELLSEKLKKKLNASLFFFRLFLFLAITALAGPRWGIGYAPSEYRRGLDIVFAVDVSRSMDITDANADENLPQSRLERGVSIAHNTVSSVSGARFAAAAGRGNGYLAVPLTYDSDAVLVFLESLDGSSITGRSTNLESLIQAASEAFQDASAARRIIVLISDGESLSGVMRNAVNQCARDGIIINAVAAGSDEGRRITERPDEAGSPLVFSRRDSAAMRAAAERTGGVYIDASREDASSILAANLLSLEHETHGSGKKEPKRRRALFVILALAAYAVSKFAARQSVFSQRGINSTLIITLVLLLSSCSEGKLLLLEANYLHSRNRYEEALVPYSKALNHEDSAPYAEYGIALTYYLMDQGDTALNRYSGSQKLLESFGGNEHRELRYRNYYNSGVIFFENEDFHSAASSFREALRADPKRLDAKRNLELSLLSIKMESKPEDKTGEQQTQREILFDYLKDEEKQRWKSREWEAEENYTGPDY